MAKIKSAIELAMEKVAHLEISEQERERLRRGERRREIEEVVNRSLQRPDEGHRALQRLLADQGSDEERENVRRLAGEVLIDKLSLDESPEPVIGALEALGYVRAAVRAGGVSVIREARDRESGSLREKLLGALRRKFARLGIAGAAVRPNVDASAELQQATEELARKYAERLNALKADLRRDLDADAA